MQINFVYDANVANAPAGFKAGLDQAAQAIGGMIGDAITVNLSISYYDLGGNTLAYGGPGQGFSLPYADLTAQLTKHAVNAADMENVAHLPATVPVGYDFVSRAQEKAWGMLSPTDAGIDGGVSFNSAFTFFDPSQPTAQGYSLLGIAEQEITHALGRIRSDAAFRLVDYSAPGVLNQSGGGYFSTDGGQTSLHTFDTSSDPADWTTTPAPGDAFDAFIFPGLLEPITPVDRTMMGVLGFNVDPTPPAPPPVPPPVPPTPPQPPPTLPAPPTTPPAPPVDPMPGLKVFDTTTNLPGTAAVQDYTGPVAGVLHQAIAITTDSLNITATTPSWFIHSGSGNDAIAVNSGTNVLDGGTGSNFLTGGTGTDTFFVDDRAPASDIWSTVAGLHAGDTVTVWGMTPSDFALSWVDGQGAAGFTGLTLHATAAGHPTASVTLAGFSQADMTSGRLSIGFGTTADLPGLPGSTFLNIHAT